MQTKNRLAVISDVALAVVFVVAPGWAVDNPAQCNPDDCVMICVSSCDESCPPECLPCPGPCPMPCAMGSTAGCSASCDPGSCGSTLVEQIDPGTLLSLDKLVTVE